ncbi:MAG: hypothetical protein P8J68_11460 [Arenicellaceae bacterium]|nr:hypothetical protein [Arenicellaceae bacterium]
MNVPLLLIDDDVIFCQVMVRALGNNGYAVSIAQDITQAKQTVA